jgi:hypothetical protein
MWLNSFFIPSLVTFESLSSPSSSHSLLYKHEESKESIYIRKSNVSSRTYQRETSFPFAANTHILSVPTTERALIFGLIDGLHYGSIPAA